MQPPDVWLDTVTPKISIAIHTLLPTLHAKGYTTLITAKKQTQTTDLLNLLKDPYETIGTYGNTPKEKLIADAERTLQLTTLFDRTGTPKVLWTHGDVAAIRTAFGLGIPVVYANDTVFATHVAKLATPLVDWLIAPISFGKSWTKFGIPKNHIILYDGLEETAWLKDTKFEKPKFLQQLEDKRPTILFRDAEYSASYCKNVKIDSQKLLKELAKLATVIALPRYDGDEKKLKDTDNVWIPPKPVLTAQLIPYVDVMVGSGGTACRETALMGIPTINFHFWDVQARYLHKRGFPIQITRNTTTILKTAKKIIQNPKKHRTNTKNTLEKLESPVPIWAHYIDVCLQAKT
jgi:predicted glycosyltransferase